MALEYVVKKIILIIKNFKEKLTAASTITDISKAY